MLTFWQVSDLLARDQRLSYQIPDHLRTGYSRKCSVYLTCSQYHSTLLARNPLTTHQLPSLEQKLGHQIREIRGGLPLTTNYHASSRDHLFRPFEMFPESASRLNDLAVGTGKGSKTGKVRSANSRTTRPGRLFSESGCWKRIRDKRESGVYCP